MDEFTPEDVERFRRGLIIFRDRDHRARFLAWYKEHTSYGTTSRTLDAIRSDSESGTPTNGE